MTALGAKAFPDDPAARAKSNADADDFLGDLRTWTAATDEANSRDEEEPTFIGGEAGAPIRGASRVSVVDAAVPPSKPSDDEDESAGRMPTPEELANAEAMLGGMSNLAKPADAKEEDLSVPGASVDVQRTLKAMRGASEKEKKWVAMREKEKGNELFKAKEFRSAIEAYTLSLKLDPDSPAVHSNRAAALMKQGRWRRHRRLHVRAGPRSEVFQGAHASGSRVFGNRGSGFGASRPRLPHLRGVDRSREQRGSKAPRTGETRGRGQRRAEGDATRRHRRGGGRRRRRN